MELVDDELQVPNTPLDSQRLGDAWTIHQHVRQVLQEAAQADVVVHEANNIQVCATFAQPERRRPGFHKCAHSLRVRQMRQPRRSWVNQGHFWHHEPNQNHHHQAADVPSSLRTHRDRACSSVAITL